MTLRPLRAAGLLGLIATLCEAAQPDGPPATLANPASVQCAQRGGTTEIRSGLGGQVGYCRLPDGRMCEEWALLRDKRCEPPQQ